MRACLCNGLWSFINRFNRFGCSFKQKSMMVTDLLRRRAASSVHLWSASNHLTTIVGEALSSSAASRPSCVPTWLDLPAQHYSMASSGVHLADPYPTATTSNSVHSCVQTRHLAFGDQDKAHSAERDRTTASFCRHYSTFFSCLSSSRLTSPSRQTIQTKLYTKQDDLCTAQQQCSDVYRHHLPFSSYRMTVPMAPDIWSRIASSMNCQLLLVFCLLVSLCNAQSTSHAYRYRRDLDQMVVENPKFNRSITQINPRMLCSDPPLVPHALSNLKRNQKHYVFTVGTEAVYMCEQGYKAVSGIDISKCVLPGQLHPNLSPLDSPDHTLKPSVALLTSGRSKNSKRLMNNFDEEEHDLNGNVGPHLPSFYFPTDKRKMSRKTNDELGPQYDSHEYDGRLPPFDGLEISKPKLDRPIWSSNVAKWTPVTLNCQPVTCPDPGEVEHATRSTNLTIQKDFYFNSNVHYQCGDDFDTIGFPMLVCRANGTWNRAPPTCRLRQCPQLPKLEGGKIIYSDVERRVDSRATYQCNQGYQLKNVPEGTHLVRHCGRNEEWTQFEPPILLPNSTAVPEPYRCVQVECPAPQRPHNGLRILGKKVQKYLPDSIIIFSCLANKNKVSAKCLSSGEWSRGPPHCPADLPFCHPITTLPNGTIKIDGSRTNFACNEGFKLVGSQTLTCNLSTGQWNFAIPVCEPTVMPSGMPSFSTIGPHDEPLEDLHQSNSKTLTIMITVIGVVVGMAVIAIGAIFCRWRKQKLQRKKWQQYFGHYHHRQSRTHIVMSNTYGGHHNGTSQPAISAAGSATAAASKHLLQRSRANSKSGSAPYLQSSFSSADENGPEAKSFNTGTISSDHARTISTYADDTCPEDEDYDDDDENSSNNSTRMLRTNDNLPTSSSISSATMAPARQHNSLPPSVTASLLVTFSGNEAAKRALSTGIDHHIYSNLPQGAIPLTLISTQHTDNRLVNGVPVTDL